MGEYNGMPAPAWIGGWPSELIPSSAKGFDWHLQCARSLYAKHNGVVYLNNGRRGDYIINRSYADGNQNTARYVDKIARMEKEGQKVSYRDLSWGITSTAPKLINAILGYWEKMDYQIFLDCLNPIAAQDRKFIMAQMKAKQALKEFNDMINKIVGMGQAPPEGFMPETLEEMQTYLEEGFRLPYEMAMELGVQMVEEENNWKLLRRQLRREFIVNGACSCKVWVDKISQRVKVRQCDLVNVIIEDFYGNDGNASKGIGEVITYTIAEARLEFGNQFTDEQYYEIAKSYVGQYGNPAQIGMYQPYVNTDIQYNVYREWDNWKVLVMDWEIYTCDQIKKKYSNKSGVRTSVYDKENRPVGKKKLKDENGAEYETEIKAIDIKTVRGGKWFINTKYMADWGKKCDIARPNENKKECYREFHFYRSSNKSMLEQVLSILDDLQLAVLNRRNVLSRIMPSGYEIEMGAFEKVFVDGAARTAEDLLTTAFETGTLIYKNTYSFEDNGQVTSAAPIKWVQRGLDVAEITAWWQEINNCIQLIRTVTGINDTMDASTPPTEQPVGTSEMALQGAENALSPIISGMIDMHEMIAYSIMLKLQVIAKNGGIEGYATLGDGVKTLIKIGSDTSVLSYSTRVQALPTQQQKQAIMQVLQEAVTSNLKTGEGGVDPEDYIKIRRHIDTGGNLKVAYLMLKSARKKAQDKMKQDKMALDKANSEGQLQAAQGAEKAKQETMMKEVEAYKQKRQFDLECKLKELEEEAKLGFRQSVTDSALKKSEVAHEKSLELSEK